MEIIYERNGKNGITLPKNIKQIGQDREPRKVFIEDYAYSYIKELHVDEDEDGVVGVLLGETKKDGDTVYSFIKGVLEVPNAAVFSDHIAFTEETWPVVKGRISQYFKDMEILGWYLVSNKITESDMFIIEKAHNDNFSGEDTVFFMFNPDNGEEKMYGRVGGKLTLLAGYVVYYERNEKMQAYMADMRGTKPLNDDGEGRYRKAIQEKKPATSGHMKKHLTFIYALSMVLIIVVLVVGLNSINSYDKMKNINKPTVQEANAEATSVTTPVNEVPGDVTTAEATTPVQEETTKKPEETTKKPEETTKKPEETTKKPEETTKKEEETTKPVETEPPYQVYIVQQGDTLSGICKKYYGEEKNTYIQNILDYNGMASAGDLLIGMELKIPNR